MTSGDRLLATSLPGRQDLDEPQEWVSIQGLQTEKTFQNARERHETCDRSRNPAAGYRPLFLARGLAVRLAFCANRCWRNVNRAPPATCSARCLIKIMHSHLHIREHRVKLAPDRGFKFDLPRPQKPCEHGSRNGWGRSGRRIPDAGGAWQYVPCRILQTSAFS